jgi:hypothetical protein
MVEHLSRKCKALSSIPGTAKKIHTISQEDEASSIKDALVVHPYNLSFSGGLCLKASPGQTFHKILFKKYSV